MGDDIGILTVMSRLIWSRPVVVLALVAVFVSLSDGTGDEAYQIRRRMRRPGGKTYRVKAEIKWDGVSKILQGWYKKSSGGRWTERIGEVMRPQTCDECDGGRLNPISRAVTLPGKKTIGGVSRMTVADARALFGMDDSVEQVTLPEERAGVVMVFRPFEQISYALVMRATRTMHVGDAVRRP